MTLGTLQAQIENREAYARSDVVTHGVGLMPGELTTTATALKVTGATSTEDNVQWRPFGRRWLDDSYKYIECSYRADIASAGEPTVTIAEGTASHLVSFAQTSTVSTGLSTATIAFQANGVTRTVALSSVVQVGNRIIDPGTNGVKARYRLRGRLEATPATQAYGIHWEITLDIYSGLDHCECWLKMGYSWVSPTAYLNSGKPYSDIQIILTQPATIAVNGPGAYMRRENKFCPAVTRVGALTTFTVWDNAAGNPDADSWNFGMMLRRRMVLIFGSLSTATANAEKLSDARASAMSWPDKWYPPFGTIPALPTYIANRAAAIARIKVKRTELETTGINGNFLGGFNVVDVPNAPNTSNHGFWTFGPMRGWLPLRAGHPALLDVIEADTYQLSLRGEYYNDDGSPWSADTHPNCQMWLGIPTSLSPNQQFGRDVLGINISSVAGIRRPGTAPGVNVNWIGPDREHWSETPQMYAALVGCDYHQMDHFETYISQQYRAQNDCRNQLFGGANPDLDNGRSYGRGETLVGCSTYEVTGDDKVLGILKDRIFIIYEQITGHNWADRRYFGHPAFAYNHYPVTHSVLLSHPPIGVGPTNAGYLYNVENSALWQDTLAVVGLWAAYLLMLERQQPLYYGIARFVAADIAKTVIRFGMTDVRGLAPAYYRFFKIAWRTWSAPITQLTGFNVIRNRSVTGLSSGATGTVVLIWDNGNAGAPFECWVKDCNATPFEASETIRFDNGTTATVNSVQDSGDFLGNYGYATNGGVPLTKEQFEETFVFQPSVANEWRAVYHNLADFEFVQMSSCAPVVAYMCGFNWYDYLGHNLTAELLAKANAIVASAQARANAYTSTTWDDVTEFLAMLPGALSTGGGTPPGAPTMGSVSNNTPNTVRLNFTAAGTETNFESRYRVATTATWSVGPTGGSGITHLDVSSLFPSTAYEAQVRGANAAGPGAWSSSTTWTSAAEVPTNPPGIPIIRPVSGVTDTTAVISWTPITSNAQWFDTRYRTLPNGVFVGGPIATAAAVSIGLTGLEKGQAYEASVRANTAAYGVSDWSASAGFTTLSSRSTSPGAPPVAAPSTLRARILENVLDALRSVNGADPYTLDIDAAVLAADVGTISTYPRAVVADPAEDSTQFDDGTGTGNSITQVTMHLVFTVTMSDGGNPSVMPSELLADPQKAVLQDPTRGKNAEWTYWTSTEPVTAAGGYIAVEFKFDVVYNHKTGDSVQ